MNSRCSHRVLDTPSSSRGSVVVQANKGFGAGSPKKADSKPKPKRAKNAVEREKCPCNSGRKYEECCEVYHRGANPPTIEATLRSRFSAFAKKKKEFILSTFHPDYHVVKYGTEPNGSIQQLIQDINVACDNFEFYDFQLKDFEQTSDTEGWITFQYRQFERPQEIVPRQDIPKWLQQKELENVRREEAKNDAFRTRVFIERSKFVKGEGGRWQFADFEMLQVPSWLNKGYASERDALIAQEEAQAELKRQQEEKERKLQGASS